MLDNNLAKYIDKNKHADLYWDVIMLLQNMEKGGTSARWLCNIYDIPELEKILDNMCLVIDDLCNFLYK